MVLGVSVRRTKKEEPADPVAREQKIQKRLFKLANAIKIPGPINQFKTLLEEVDEDRVIDLFSRYKPETRAEKRKRMESEDPRSGPRPLLIKFGLKHITDLIMRKKLGIVLIAADVTPVTVVLFLPTLCKKMGIPYVIVKSKETLGGLVNLKSSAAVGLETVRAEDKAALSDVVRMADSVFSGQYEKHMTTVGGGRVNLKDSECLRKETFSN